VDQRSDAGLPSVSRKVLGRGSKSRPCNNPSQTRSVADRLDVDSHSVIKCGTIQGQASIFADLLVKDR